MPLPLIPAPQDLLCAWALSPLLRGGCPAVLTPYCPALPTASLFISLTQMSLLPEVQLGTLCWVDPAEWEHFSEFPSPSGRSGLPT